MVSFDPQDRIVHSDHRNQQLHTLAPLELTFGDSYTLLHPCCLQSQRQHAIRIIERRPRQWSQGVRPGGRGGARPFDESYRPTSIRCRSHALPQPEENADAAAIRCRSPVVQRVGHLEQNAIRNMEMPSGTAIGVAPGQKSLSQ